MKNIALRLVFILFIFLFVGGLVYAGTPTPANSLLVEAALLILEFKLWFLFLPTWPKPNIFMT